MSDDETTAGESYRRTAARERVVAAREALGVARERLDQNASRGVGVDGRLGAAVVVLTAIVAVVAVVAVVVTLILHDRSGPGRESGLVRSASTAVATILTADPAHPDRYLAAARSVSGGEYRRRIDAAGPAIEAAVASLGSPGTGQVVAAGVTGTVRADGPGEVLVVAETTAPQLVGGSVGDRRIVVSVTMIREAGAWVIGQVALR
ncbi:MAG: hypothetical protein PGN29_19745 [Gordonia paraffinivorans]